MTIIRILAIGYTCHYGYDIRPFKKRQILSEEMKKEAIDIIIEWLEE